MSRLPPQPGERIDRDAVVAFTFDGKQVAALAGDTIGSALYAAGLRTTLLVCLAASPSVLGTDRFLTLLSQDRLLPELTGPPLHPDELAVVNLRPRTRAFTAITRP